MLPHLKQIAKTETNPEQTIKSIKKNYEIYL